MSSNKSANKNVKKNCFVPISPVRDEVKRFSSNRSGSGDQRKPWTMFNEVERHLDQNKVSRNLSEWFKNPGKPYNSYVKKIVKERLKYDD